MGRVIVGYGLRSDNEAKEERQEAAARSWAAARSRDVLLWRRDGSRMAKEAVERRTRLHHALFCIRARLADDLWVPERHTLRDPWSLAIVLAEVWLCGGQVVVEGNIVPFDAGNPHQRATRSWVRLANRIAPRQRTGGKAGPADIGEYYSREEAARLAHKLDLDFLLPEREVARLLQEAEYPTPAGDWYTASGVNNLKRSFDREDGVELASLWDPIATSLMANLLVTFGPDADLLVESATAYNTSLQDPHHHVMAIVAAATEDPLDEHPELIRLLRGLTVIGTVMVSSETHLARTAEDRAIVRAYLRHHEVVLLVRGERVDLEAQGVEETELQNAADSVVRLHSVLRAHDAGSVQDARLSIRAARELALAKSQEWDDVKLREIAHVLNAEGYPTRKRVGRWHPASARELLKDDQ